MKQGKIKVSRKILADVGRGIYKTPANAIKELVSNAFDACATRVGIATNAPYFDTLTCEDNGKGMTLDEFGDILGRIGSSTKRANRAEFIDCRGIERPIIGKIGIGLLSVSQICDRFTVISKTEGQEHSFEAAIDMLQFEKDDAYSSGEGEIALGEYEIVEKVCAPEEISNSYTKIVMSPLRKGFQRDLMREYKNKILRVKETVPQVLCFADFAKPLSNKDFRSIGTYDYMLWELGLLCPIKYLEEDEDIVFPSLRFIKEDIERLDSYKFRLFVDGLEVYRPIFFLKSDKIQKEDEDFKVYILPRFDEEVDGETLTFHGHIYAQRTKITPTELQGILVRIKDVGIGGYDKSILKYQRQEGPIFGMISGEVMIERGLESALNIDRNSFNETHPHYQELQFQIHSFIKDRVAKDMRQISRKRRTREKTEKLNMGLKALSEAIADSWGIDIKFEIQEQIRDQLYSFDKNDSKLTFYTKTRGWSRSEGERLLQMKLVSALILMEHFSGKIDVGEVISDLVFGKK